MPHRIRGNTKNKANPITGVPDNPLTNAYVKVINGTTMAKYLTFSEAIL